MQLAGGPMADPARAPAAAKRPPSYVKLAEMRCKLAEMRSRTCRPFDKIRRSSGVAAAGALSASLARCAARWADPRGT